LDGTTRLWDIRSGKELRQFEGGGARYSPDGKTIVTSSDNSASLWDAASGQKSKEFTLPQGIVINYPVISPDGKYLLAGDSEGVARLWDIQTGQEIRRFIGHTASVENVVFSPDGKYVLTGSDDGTAMLWDVDYSTTMHYLCSQLQRDFTPAEQAEYSITNHSPTCPK
jgi:WD40 repeat protein